ncbi:MAG TPA: CHAT domain-containing tetratricopeptide repeat protein, partial [Thermoanaerobaculia bacterium]|nr:CHAT domain-containing tetratricopeptide repeat protein [Thermoanaerobaculia bacterium]
KKRGDFGLALAYAQRGLRYRRQAGNPRGVAVTLTSIGTIFEARGDPSQARKYQEEALAIFRQIQDVFGEATALVNIGNLFIGSDPVSAISRLEKGVFLARQVGLKEVEFVGLFGLARAERARGNPQAAIRRAKEAMALADSLGNAPSEEEPRTASEAARQGIYKLLVDLLIKSPAFYTPQEDMAEAFEASDRRRQRILLNSLSPSRMQKENRRRVAPDLAEDLESLDREINSIEEYRRRSGERESSNRLNALVEERRTLETQIRQKESGASTSSRPSPASLKQAQLMLEEGAVLLQYELGDPRSFLWKVTANSVEVYELASRLEIERSARRFQALLSKSWNGEQLEQAAAEGRRLSRMLFGPVVGKLDAQRILIVPDGALYYVSFSALPHPSGGGFKSKSLWPMPLIGRHEVVVIPTVSVMKVFRMEYAGRRKPKGGLAVFADPRFDEKQNKRLPHSRLEAKSILALAPLERRLEAVGSKATRALFTSGALKDYGIIHLATHASNHPEHPELATIVLAQKDGSGQAIDGYLRQYEIQELQLPADLVVLSGCETALGTEIEGEGLVGLTQAFFHAGAARVVASLWKVNDRSTSIFMERFYHAHLVEKQSPAEALRTAQLWMAQHELWSSPYYWGGFQMQGEWQ